MADAAPQPAADATAPSVALPDLAQRIEWFEDWEEKTRDSRRLAMRDRRYYDGDQWSQDDLDRLKKRRQPPITKNEIAPAINFILGEEIRKRVDPVARPRTPQHEDASRAATDALRFVEEEQQFDQARSAVLKNALVEGFGGAVKGLSEDGKHELTHVEWDRLGYDPHSRKLNFDDAKYRLIVTWHDIDDAVENYRDKEAEIRAAVTQDISPSDDTTEDTPRTWSDRKRQRIKVVEMYFRVGGEWYRADFTKGADLLEPQPTGYRDEHGRSVCPLIMMSCYIDSNGMRYGVVRSLISPQDEINKRSSKALFLLNVRQAMAERDVVMDPQKFMDELAKPDGFIEVEPGSLASPDGPRIIISQTADLAQGQVQLLQDAYTSFQRIAPASANVPDLPSSASGRAVLARQQAASQELGSVFDALRNWTHAVYEIDWLCIRQFWTEEKWLRVTDDQENNGYRFVALNRQMTRAERMKELLEKNTPQQKALEMAAGNMAPRLAAMAQQAVAGLGELPPEQQQQALTQALLSHPMMAEPVMTNQVEQMLVDIIIDETQESAVIEQEEFEKFTELGPSLVQSGMDPREFAKMTVQLSQLRNKREVLAALDKGPDPQQAQMQQQMQQLQAMLQQAQLALTQSQAQLNQAKALGEQAKAEALAAKTPSEVEKNQAAAMRDAAQAGAQAAGR